MIEMKSLDENLYEAMDQALGYYLLLKKDKEPRFILACDFQNWYLRDKKDNIDYFFKLSELVDNIGLFGFMINRPKVVKADPVNAKASIMLGEIFDLLKESGYPSHQAEYFLTRLVFCLFADDTGIFAEKGKFQNYIKEHTSEDGSDLGQHLAHLFTVLNMHRDARSKTLNSKINSFPYINGALFEKPIEFPNFDANMRVLLIEAGEYDWSKVSPVIFGTMFQTVMDPDARREMGAHYTSEENILKVIRPLFLDDLNKEFDEIDKKMDDSWKERFLNFQNKLSHLKFLDPACGSGNFLVVAYREIRRLEHRVIMKIYGYDGQRNDTDELSKVNVDQFFGIEIIEFSSRIAETSLWMMDHLMNIELSQRYGLAFRRIPIKKKPSIVCKDALEFDWNELLPNVQCSYVFGNPPFGGIRELTKYQNSQLVRIADLEKRRGMLDYVSAWFIQSAKYITDKTLISFVATNSITQGIQVEQLWSVLQKEGLEIIFAYKAFKWTSDARNKANVTVVIIGMAKKYDGKKYLFKHKQGSLIKENVTVITPYLNSSIKEATIVKKTPNPINNLPKLRKGMAITDGDNYTFTEDEKNQFLIKEPEAESYFREFVTAKGLLHDEKRWILLVYLIKAEKLKKMTETRKLIKAVEKFRLSSKKPETRKLAKFPTKFERPIVPSKEFLVIPVVSSEKREYIPLGFLKPPLISSAATIICEGADVSLFALLSSKIHMVWLKSIGGKLETRLRYSNIVYNTFPVPANHGNLKALGDEILKIREKLKPATLADLYDPITMPIDLKKAHDKLDKAVEKLYRDKPFQSDQERLEFLLEKYQKMASKQTTL